jgi:hypothetical protein
MAQVLIYGTHDNRCMMSSLFGVLSSLFAVFRGFGRFFSQKKHQ